MESRNFPRWKAQERYETGTNNGPRCCVHVYRNTAHVHVEKWQIIFHEHIVHACALSTYPRVKVNGRERMVKAEASAIYVFTKLN